MSDSLKDRMVKWVQELQDQIVAGLESFEDKSRFQKEEWTRPGGGGGDSRVLQGGDVFEKAGVNTSVVHGDLPPLMMDRLGTKNPHFFATGISLVLHPRSPRIPTVHMNYRYFEQPDRHWFGGGADLTPYVFSEVDFRHFHQTLKKACDKTNADLYLKYKKECDEYFKISHREETRGIGGIFFDYLKEDAEKTFEFVQNCGNSFLEAYSPIVKRNLNEEFSERQKMFQLWRRGRYVEFNLVYDRGTLFGLQTKGNIESILMSLPPEVRFDYKPNLESNDEEKILMSCFRNPREWT